MRLAAKKIHLENASIEGNPNFADDTTTETRWK